MMIKHPLSFLGGCVAGALAMYYLDQRSGAHRRALVRDKLVSAGHEVADVAQAKGKRAMDRVYGVLATGRLDGRTRRPPESDEQLHERIRSRLGRIVSHPRLVDAKVDRGCVCLVGHVLRSEFDRVLDEVRDMPGVQQVDNQLQLHERRDELQNLPSPMRQAGEPAQAVH